MDSHIAYGMDIDKTRVGLGQWRVKGGISVGGVCEGCERGVCAQGVR